MNKRKAKPRTARVNRTRVRAPVTYVYDRHGWLIAKHNMNKQQAIAHYAKAFGLT